MKLFQKIFFISILSVIASCSTENKTEVAQIEGVKVTRSVVPNAPEPKCTAKISLEGMSCAKMCGGSIKKCLKGIEGVNTADIYFDPERKKSDFATIEYDQKAVTEKEMIAAIEKLHDGQYKVKSIEIIVSEVSYEKIEKEDTKKNEKANGKVTAFNNMSIAVPSIFEILSRVLQ